MSSPGADDVTAPPAPALAVDRLGKSIDELEILADITFELGPGDYAALLGANGAGKSTLLRVISTLLPATSGGLAVHGHAAGRDSAAIRARIGLIGHQPMLYRDLSARENLMLFGRLYGVSEAATRAAELLGYVDLSARADDPAKTFSRGMLQRLAIARALMHDPALLLADEPFAGLDPPSRDALERLLADLHAKGRTILLANHDVDQSLRIADRILVLRRGRLCLDRRASDLAREQILQEIDPR